MKFNSIFKLNRYSPLHLFLTSVYNAFFSMVPHGLKYNVGLIFKKNRLPYSLVQPGNVIVQIGAPRDTLAAGRTRAMYFSQLVGVTGCVVVMEPDPENIAFWENHIVKHNIRNIRFVPKGAWDCEKTLEFLTDPSHPAANLVAEVCPKNFPLIENYRRICVPVTTLDAVVKSLGIDRIDLISITTNGSEIKILDGAKETIGKGVTYIAFANTNKILRQLMVSSDYSIMGADDRGFTFTLNLKISS